MPGERSPPGRSSRRTTKTDTERRIPPDHVRPADPTDLPGLGLGKLDGEMGRRGDGDPTVASDGPDAPAHPAAEDPREDVDAAAAGLGGEDREPDFRPARVRL